MKRYKSIFMSAAVLSAMAVGVTACGGDDDDDAPSAGSSTVEFRPTLSDFSRTSDAAFTSNDAISVWAMESTNYSATPLNPSRSFANNVKYTYQGGRFKGNIKKADDLTLNYYAVYPFSSQNSDHFNFSIKTDQTSIENYMASDLCVARTNAVTSELVDLNFVHAMAKVIINIDSSLGTATSIEFTAKPSVTLDLNSYSVMDYGTPVEVKMNKASTNSFRAIVPICDIEAGALMAVVHTSKGDYTWEIESDYSFNSGKVYSFDLSKNTNDASSESISFTATILPWDTATN